MTDKRFYGEAFDEVQSGKVDHPLWVKVNSENAQAEKVTIQAAYISAGAQELAFENAREKIVQAKEGLQSRGRKLFRQLLVWSISIGAALFVVVALAALYVSASKVHHLISGVESGKDYVNKLREDINNNPNNYQDPSFALKQAESQMDDYCDSFRDAQKGKVWYPFPDRKREAEANDDCTQIRQVVRQNQR